MAIADAAVHHPVQGVDVARVGDLVVGAVRLVARPGELGGAGADGEVRVVGAERAREEARVREARATALRDRPQKRQRVAGHLRQPDVVGRTDREGIEVRLVEQQLQQLHRRHVVRAGRLLDQRHQRRQPGEGQHPPGPERLVREGLLPNRLGSACSARDGMGLAEERHAAWRRAPGAGGTARHRLSGRRQRRERTAPGRRPPRRLGSATKSRTTTETTGSARWASSSTRRTRAQIAPDLRLHRHGRPREMRRPREPQEGDREHPARHAGDAGARRAGDRARALPRDRDACRPCPRTQEGRHDPRHRRYVGHRVDRSQEQERQDAHERPVARPAPAPRAAGAPGPGPGTRPPRTPARP